MQRLSHWINRKDNQYFTYNLSTNSSNNTKNIPHFLTPLHYPELTAKRPTVNKKFTKIKMLATLSGIAVLSLPAKSLTTALFSTEAEAYDTNSKK
ncbi:hypothetical protein [Psychrobacter sanguinis]|uniref:hypothetical protein n=1 Tax=Psychrobacter sanguinis TaxID=861445 RepID=UPI001D111DF3|nr:hypothetical protein [Psychrobacter sanguinis]UEC24729.1 hypothetical protein LK453_09235 [Psychrobacter sanguinis]